MIVRQFRGLFLEGRPEATEAALRAVVAQQDGVRRLQAETLLGPAIRGEERLIAMVPRASFSADVVLVRELDNEVVAVFEWKVGGDGNLTLRSTTDAQCRAAGTVADKILTVNDADPGRSPKKGANAVPQIDAYRAWRWWDAAPDFKISDPDKVLWVFADLAGTPIEDLYVDAVSSGDWALLDVQAYIRDLYRAGVLFEESASHDAVAVFGWGLWSRGHDDGVFGITDTASPEDWVAGLGHDEHGLTVDETKYILQTVHEEQDQLEFGRVIVDALEKVWKSLGTPSEGVVWDELNSEAELLEDTAGRLVAALGTLHFGRRFHSIHMPTLKVALTDVEGLSADDGIALGLDEWAKHGLLDVKAVDAFYDASAQYGRDPGRADAGGRDGFTVHGFDLGQDMDS